MGFGAAHTAASVSMLVIAYIAPPLWTVSTVELAEIGKQERTHTLKALTEKQKQILEFVKGNLVKKGPSFSSIRLAFGYKSNQAVSDHLKALQRKGYLDEKYLPTNKRVK